MACRFGGFSGLFLKDQEENYQKRKRANMKLLNWKEEDFLKVIFNFKSDILYRCSYKRHWQANWNLFSLIETQKRVFRVISCKRDIGLHIKSPLEKKIKHLLIEILLFTAKTLHWWCLLQENLNIHQISNFYLSSRKFLWNLGYMCWWEHTKKYV